jgi:hypothetical protein
LYRYFVYYDIDANIEANVIVPLAQHFVANNWEIAPVLDKLFKSQHFYDMANYGVYIKSPFDLVIGSLRTFNINYNVTDQTNYFAQYSVWSAISSRYLLIKQWEPFQMLQDGQLIIKIQIFMNIGLIQIRYKKELHLLMPFLMVLI